MNDFSFIMLAGGSGSRVGWDIPKQFIRIAGKTLLEHSLDCLVAVGPEAKIVVVAPGDLIDMTRSIVSKYKNAEVIIGGSTRQGSTLSALKHMSINPPKNIIIHEAARPFLNKSILFEVIDALEEFEAVDVAIPASDTIIVENDGLIQSIPNRNKIWRGQTPQAFRFTRLSAAYQQLSSERLGDFTDDCGVVLAADPFARIKIVRGSSENIKVTEESDLVIADEFFRIRSNKIDPNLKGVDFKGKSALIFGGSAGIGLAMQQILVGSGCQVSVASRATGCDIAKFGDVERTIEQAHKSHGKLNYVINTAGLLLTKPIAEQTAEMMADQIQINLLGTLNVAKASFDSLRETKGMLLNFSSSSYTRGRGGYVPYSASKAAIVNLTQGLAEEWEDDEIRVNCIVPGRTDTEMRRNNFFEEDPATLLSPYEVALTATKALHSSNSGFVLRI